LTHPDVADTAVIGIPDLQAGELPKAYIVVKQGHHVTEKDIADWLQPKVPHYKLLRGGIEFTAEIPKVASFDLSLTISHHSHTLLSHSLHQVKYCGDSCETRKGNASRVNCK